mmetsp:Transcript_66325/g.76960  ORF Transcript_66325/g.76960 Transcript_66325/m.76960 type:complete len:227 (+) Transcript_66325:80-760(+)
MGRLRVTPSGKVKKNIPITRIGKKQYLKRRFAHVRKVDNAGKENALTQKYVAGNHTAMQSYTRLGLNVDPSAPKAVVEARKKFVKPHMKARFENPPEARKTLGQPVSEQEGCMIGNLLVRYGTDLKRMSLDRKLNPFQLNPRQLQRRIVNYLRLERAAFPEQYDEAAKNGWLEDYTDKNLRKWKREEEAAVVPTSETTTIAVAAVSSPPDHEESAQCAQPKRRGRK